MVIVRLGRNITIPTISVYTVHGDLVFPFVDSPGYRGVTNFYFSQTTVNRDRCMGKVWSLLLTGILGFQSFGIKKISAIFLGMKVLYNPYECMDLCGVFVDIDTIPVSFYMSLNHQINASVSEGKTATYRFHKYTYTTQ